MHMLVAGYIQVKSQSKERKRRIRTQKLFCRSPRFEELTWWRFGSCFTIKTTKMEHGHPLNQRQCMDSVVSHSIDKLKKKIKRKEQDHFEM
ncbi:hypothetical protein FRX31_033472 [Thalictrum thalictroides]|uniref:Uncharacterized protein n=1 Tax=Thalictrum thalictroides TaxID=46969 RepID=A0A7J6UXM6_THATH|nr:hypothetical protein FRX31_033472 [Thalictrum thalictroides]